MPQQQPQAYHGNTIRSPAASYPNAYRHNTVSQANHYQYHGQQDHLPMNQHGHGIFDDLARLEPRSNTPYGRSSQSTHVSRSSYISPPPRPYSPPSVSPVSPEEPTIKKKRKRADAAQLKVLNETYNRTAFPSTEERPALAKMLDMSARNVQIWFQNKRQSMRQINRQTASSSAHHPFSMGGQVDPMAEELEPHPQAGYDGVSGHLGDVYLTGPMQDTSRSHGSRPNTPEPRRLPTLPSFLQQSFASAESSLRGTGFGPSVNVADQDATPLADGPSPTMSKRGQMLIERPSLQQPLSRILQNSFTVSSPSSPVSSPDQMTQSSIDTVLGCDNFVYTSSESTPGLLSDPSRHDPWLEQSEPPSLTLASYQMLQRVGPRIPGEEENSRSSSSLYIPKSRRIPIRRMKHSFTNPESPLRGKGFGDSVLVEENDGVPPAGGSAPTMRTCYQILMEDPSLRSSLTPIPPDFSVSRSPTLPAQVQRGPTATAQEASQLAAAVTTAEHASPTHQSSATRPDSMSHQTAVQAQLFASWAQNPDNGRPYWDYPPEPTSTGRQDKVVTQEGNPICLMCHDKLHPRTVLSQQCSHPHMKPPARPGCERASSALMFPNAQVKILGGTFQNFVHIYGRDSPAPPGGRLAPPITVPGQQGYSSPRARTPHNVPSQLHYIPYRHPHPSIAR
ncbi:hypothetical protein D9619_002018 [Psilocybe cf. subviscida]|uniref:Homeobox domain-containing protein n=1 Tax=Psilocybe cf. subviscida TaxID=2480587 RepID=A0A8H5F3W1_9AGAR|nr:hypothetical protein D9619_002018 [Psilocybe cf. subviscida]